MFNELIEEIKVELEKIDENIIKDSVLKVQKELKEDLDKKIKRAKEEMESLGKDDYVSKMKLKYEISFLENEVNNLMNDKNEFVKAEFEKNKREINNELIKKVVEALAHKAHELNDLISQKETELSKNKVSLYEEITNENRKDKVLELSKGVRKLNNSIIFNRNILEEITKIHDEIIIELNKLDTKTLSSDQLSELLNAYITKIKPIKRIIKISEINVVNKSKKVVKVSKKDNKKIVNIKAHVRKTDIDNEEIEVQKLIEDAVLNSNSSYLTKAEQLLEKSSLDDKIKSKLNSKIVETKNKLDIKDADESFAKIREKVNSGSYDKQEMLKEIEKLKKMYDVIFGASTVSDVKKKEYFYILNKIIFKYNKDSQDSLQYKISGTEDMVNAFPKTSLKEIVKLSTKCLFGKLRKNKNIDFTNTPMVLIKKNYISKKKFGILNNRLSYEEEKKYDDAKKVISKNLIKGIKKSKVYDKYLCDRYIELIKTMPKYISYRKEYDEYTILKNANKCFENALKDGNITEEEYDNYINLSNDICLYRNNMRNCYELSENSNVISYVDMDLINLMEMKQKLNSK